MALYPKRKGKKKYQPGNRKKKADRIVDEALNSYKQSKKARTKVDKLLAEGVAIHTVVNSRTSTGILDKVQDLQNPDLENREKLVDLSRKLRLAEGVCGSVADLLVDFAITKGSFYSDNPELKDILNKWAGFINSVPDLSTVTGVILPTSGLRALSRKIFDDYIVDGDAVFSLFWASGVKMDITGDGDALFLPTSAKVIDTMTLLIDPELAQLGVEQITLVLSDAVKGRITDPKSDADKFLKENIPPEWLKSINSGEDIILNPNVTYHLKRNAKDYKPWGQGYFVKAFSAVAAKRRLQAVDDATIDGLINRFTIFKLGLEDREKNPAYHIPSAARVAALVNILTSQKRSNAAVWPGPDLDVIDIGPDGKILDMDGKFKQADKDILRSLHVSPMLIDGTSTGQSADDFLSFLATEVGLDAVRSELEAAFSSIGKEIALANNIEYEQLYYKFETLMLKDQERVRNFALKVFELGGISVETFVKTMGYDFKTERNLKETEDSDGTKELFINENVPGFTGVAPDGTKEGEDPDSTKEGRPPGPDDTTEAKLKAEGNPLDEVTLYYTLYKSTFDKIKKDMQRSHELVPSEFGLVHMSLVNGLAQFRMLVDTQLRATYRRASGGKVNKDLKSLFKWNANFIDNFHVDLREEIDKNPSDFLSVLNSDATSYRIYLYATESARKAFWVGTITKARVQRKTKATWKCNNQDSKCVENHDKSFDLDFLVDNFPGHPNCNCTLDFV